MFIIRDIEKRHFGIQFFYNGENLMYYISNINKMQYVD